MRRNTVFTLTLMGVLLVLAPPAWGQWPYPTPEGYTRVMAWNIEFLNTRTPPRTPEQLDLLTQRIAGFDASVLALQEISQQSVLQDIAADLGPTWRIVTGGLNTLLYDESKLALVSGGPLANLSAPPYTPYPRGVLPISGVFEPVGGGEAFRVIGVHCHPGSSTTREAEGQWLRDRVLEFLDTPGEPEDIFVLGDYNGRPGGPPHPTLQQGGDLGLLPKRYGPGIGGFPSYDVEHCSGTRRALDRVDMGSVLLIRATDYGETWAHFEATYSDSYPNLVDVADVLVPGPGPGPDLYAQAVLDDNPMLHWRLGDHPCDTAAADAAGSGRDGTYQGGVVRWHGGIPGAADTATRFWSWGGVVVDEDAEAYLAGDTDLALEMWVKADGIGHDRGLLRGEGAGGGPATLGFRYDEQGWLGGGSNVITAVIRTTEGLQRYESGSDVQSSDWQHLVINWTSGQGIELYINGVLDEPTFHGEGDGLGRDGVIIGGSLLGLDSLLLGSAEYSDWLGLIDEFAIYDNPLSPEQIQEHYGLGIIPEPATLALLVLGVLGLRRRLRA